MDVVCTGSWKQSPMDTEGQLSLGFGGVESHRWILRYARGSVPLILV